MRLNEKCCESSTEENHRENNRSDSEDAIYSAFAGVAITTATESSAEARGFVLQQNRKREEKRGDDENPIEDSLH